MAVNWLLGAQQGPDPGQRFQMGFELAQNRQRDDMLLRQHQEQQEMQRRQAKNEDQAAQQRQIAEAAQTLGPIYQQLQRMPYEQRRPWLQQVAPRLTARGIPQQIIAEYDPTDQNLQADIALSVRAAQGEGFTLSPGQVRYGPGGQEIARGPEERPRYYSVPQGGQLVIEPGAQGAPQPPQVGAIEDGYRFRGGNPADPNSWEPVAQGGPSPGGSGNFR